MIEVKNVSFHYKYQENTLENINLEIKENEIVCIVGKNGSGKSTLLKLMAGLDKPTKGEILVDDLDIMQKKDFEKIRKKVGIVFQNPESQILFPKVHDDIAFALKNLNLENVENRIEEALKLVNMSKFKNQDAYDLSLGQKQRINLASVLAIKPQYILLDEPTTMIDSLEKENVYKIIKNLKEEEISVVFVTNNANEMLLADRIILLENKTIRAEIQKHELLDKVDLLQKANIKLPDILEILLKLKENDINLTLKEWTNGELIDEIVKVCKE